MKVNTHDFVQEYTLLECIQCGRCTGGGPVSMKTGLNIRGIIYEALGVPVDMFPVMFAIPRTVGWLAQWEEMLLDEEQKIARPRQIYLGAEERNYVSRR